MKKILVGLTILFSFLQSFGQAGNDSTKYIQYKFQYGSRMPRMWADSVMLPPKDTTYSKYGLAIKAGVLYYGNGTKWTASASGSGSGTDSAHVAGVGLKKSIASTVVTDFVDTFFMATRAWRNKGKDSVQGNLTAGLLLKLNITDTSSHWVSNIANNTGGDSLLWFVNGVRHAVKYPAGGAGSQTLNQTVNLGNTFRKVIENDSVRGHPANLVGYAKDVLMADAIDNTQGAAPFVLALSATGGLTYANNVAYFGWNFDGSGGIRVAGMPALGFGFEQQWRPDLYPDLGTNINYSEMHLVWWDSAGNNSRLFSYTLNNKNHNITLYFTTDVFDFRNHSTGIPYFAGQGLTNSTSIDLINSIHQNQYYDITASFATDSSTSRLVITAPSHRPVQELLFNNFTVIKGPGFITMENGVAKSDMLFFRGNATDLGQIAIDSLSMNIRTLTNTPIRLEPNNGISADFYSDRINFQKDIVISGSVTTATGTEVMRVYNPDHNVTTRLDNTFTAANTYGLQIVMQGSPTVEADALFLLGLANGGASKNVLIHAAASTIDAPSNMFIFSESPAQSEILGRVRFGDNTLTPLQAVDIFGKLKVDSLDAGLLSSDSVVVWSTSSHLFKKVNQSSFSGGGGGTTYTFPFSVVAPGNAIQLQNDTSATGAGLSSYYYGYNAAGRRGFYLVSGGSSQWTTTGSDIYFAHNVKIGASGTPDALLHLFSATTNGAFLELDGSGTTGSNNSHIDTYLSDGSNTKNWATGIWQAYSDLTAGVEWSSISLYTNKAGAIAKRFVFNGDRLGINNTSPDSVLDVVGGAKILGGLRVSLSKTSGLKNVKYDPATDKLSYSDTAAVGGGGANALGTYLVQTATNAPANAQIMASLGTGIVKNTTTTGVQSIAIAADFPTLNQNTSGSAATVTTTINSGVVATTQSQGDNSTKVATTAYIDREAGHLSTSITSAGTVTITQAKFGFVVVDPAASIVLTINLPASPLEGDIVRITAGGTLSNGSSVVSTLTLSGNGHTLYGATTPGSLLGGDTLEYQYSGNGGLWRRIKL